MGDKLTFRAGVIAGVVIKPLRRFGDARGWLSEIFRQDEIAPEAMPVMGYVSMTLPGVTRGPHEHVEQTDLFAFVGPGTFRIVLWDARPDSPTYGVRQELLAGADAPHAVLVPPGVVHAYRNVSSENGLVFNVPNRLYAGPGRKHKVDEIRHEDRTDGLYSLDEEP
jgi:dTDP-4-dehydrorhamnose 3,5-epimerase